MKMNKEQIETTIKKVAENGFLLETKTTEDNSIILEFGNCKFTFDFNSELTLTKSVIRLDYGDNFDKEEEKVNYLCSIALYLSIYKNRIDFRIIPKNEKNLEVILERLLKSHN